MEEEKAQWPGPTSPPADGESTDETATPASPTSESTDPDEATATWPGPTTDTAD